MRPGEISKSSGILLKPQYMFTFNLRCVPLGLSQTSWATPSPTQFCSLCIGGSRGGLAIWHTGHRPGGPLTQCGPVRSAMFSFFLSL